ncbi:MAG: hypothetical protein ACOY99_12805 [Pseudomonadota bacterium]|jgi:hypothetical protein
MKNAMIAVLLGLGLLGCEAPAPVTPFKLDGRWAWDDTANCAAKGNWLVIDGTFLSLVWRGRTLNTIAGLSWWVEEGEGGARLSWRYVVKGRPYEERFAMIDEGRLVLEASLVAGAPAPGADRLIGRALVRCPADGEN